MSTYINILYYLIYIHSVYVLLYSTFHTKYLYGKLHKTFKKERRMLTLPLFMYVLNIPI